MSDLINKSADIADLCPGIELNDHAPEIAESFYYVGDSVVALDDAVDSVITSFRSGWWKFKDLVSLLASKDLPPRPKRLSIFHACM